jgi:hypothetical protein
MIQQIAGTVNPYKQPAGKELDRMIHTRLFHGEGGMNPPPYSMEESLVPKIAAKLKQRFKKEISTGTLNIRPRRYFARFETGASTSTEVVAESLCLAICRLALLVMEKHEG